MIIVYYWSIIKLLSKNLDLHSSKCERFVFVCDLNVRMENEAIKVFCNLCHLTSLNNKPTCYKNPANPSCIYLILTNCPKYLQNITVNETGLSDFHKTVVTIMKANFHKLELKIVHYWNYKNLTNELFREIW